MKLFFLTLILFAFLPVQAQVVTKPLKKTISLAMPRTVDDEMPGTRGASVVWHPLQKKYYASMAGNIEYPMAVYDAAGKKLSSDTLNTEQDIRGMWYNPISKRIQGNSYSDYGWFEYTLNEKGIPASTEIFIGGMNQPGENLVGAYSIAKQQVMFLMDGEIWFYNMNGEELDARLKLQWGRQKSDGESTDEIFTPEAYNFTSLVYTGIKNAELGVLNILYMQVELYDIDSGFMTQKLKLPEETALYDSFNFAFTNGMYWLFNIERRTWTGYK